jgi:hypothetical protein
VFEFINFPEAFVWLFEIEINDVDLVVHGVCIVTRYGHLEFVIFSVSESNRVILKATVISVYLFGLSFFRQMINFIHYFVCLTLCLAKLLLLLLITLLQKRWLLLLIAYNLLLLNIRLFLFF